MRAQTVLAVCAALVGLSARGADASLGMDRTKFHIGGAFLRKSVMNDAMVADFAASGCDLAVIADNVAEGHELMRRHGLGCIVSGVLPGSILWPRNWLQVSPEDYTESKRTNFVENAGIWGIDIADEPCIPHLEKLGELITHFETLFTNRFPFVNLLPTYVSESALGGTYAEYLEKYCASCPTLDYISFDHYCYSVSIAGFYRNLALVADCCSRKGRSMWNYLQAGVEPDHGDQPLNLDQFRFQASAAMAFGSEAIFWACYMPGWWNFLPVTSTGEKTVSYDRMRTANAEIRTLAEEYMRFARSETHFVGFSSKDGLPSLDKDALKTVKVSDAVTWGGLREIRATDGGPLLVTCLQSRGNDWEKGVFVFAADDPYGAGPKERTVSFTVSEDALPETRCLTVLCSRGAQSVTRGAKGTRTVRLQSNEAALVFFGRPTRLSSSVAESSPFGGFDAWWRMSAVSGMGFLALTAAGGIPCTEESAAELAVPFDNQWRDRVVSPGVDELTNEANGFFIWLR